MILSMFPRSIVMREREGLIIIGTKEGPILFVDYDTSLERDRIHTGGESVHCLEYYLVDKDKKFLSTSKNAIYLWNYQS